MLAPRRIFTALFCTVLFIALGLNQAALADTYWVQVSRSSLRSEPKHYAPAVGALSYGDKLEAGDAQEGWFKVTANGGKTGFVHESALIDREVVITGRKAASKSAVSSDVVLASKGFSKDIEREYKKKGTASRFDLVDRMEAAPAVSAKELQQFVQLGELKG
jgi:Bacterial SH3 domain